jgi:hypothetical protein
MWDSFCHYLKECGRDGCWFLYGLVPISLAAFFWEQGGDRVLLGLLLLLALRTVRGCCRSLRAPEKVGRQPPLSENEWKIARAKLLRPRSGMRSATPSSTPRSDRMRSRETSR